MGKNLNDDKSYLVDANIVITNEEKIQFNIDQMCNRATFKKEEKTKCDKKTEFNRMWEKYINYFEDLLSNIKMYQSNSGGTSNIAQYDRSDNGMEEQQEEGDLW